MTPPSPKNSEEQPHETQMSNPWPSPPFRKKKDFSAMDGVSQEDIRSGTVLSDVIPIFLSLSFLMWKWKWQSYSLGRVVMRFK